MAKRLSKAELQLVIDYTVSLVRRNLTYKEKIDLLKEHTGKGEDMCVKYIRKAYKQLKEYSDRDIEEVRIDFVEGYIQDLKEAYHNYETFINMAGEYSQADKWWNNYQKVKLELAKFYPDLLEANDDDLNVILNIVRIKKNGKT